ncbi:acyl-(acyl carrier protein)--phosphate acyltransferase [Geotalea daltonii FRC-32]|uniref:Phosphate acyltransferase n=1 Tax=Geotalea daltonii (strain DSM 22248 / JCM 15807 / FRC-32) TaxID=316067 RepID=PLSX_GEODF|nr:phosphate acyltransferase PlsX [Geotalea daltonii]B9M0V8.1 RecName: Full=Phosphate acyltransferase; AltName: Full=Acyl-ACP phosphotransacylase; AltName: Full=Acyl-[acyl-carrier-protein]--phosphate acyltransferase; AltName: Full=Phosphate-acyl-ACP acyltransferase [Geotalea daltonii FRC-32]ACM20961.1 acyl-(acyl carrier protein)--phosphate acyltransferase [Geotalea daltonii FRC-32]
MRVAVDAMGGDNAPGVEVEGAVAAAREFGIAITLVGDTEKVNCELAKHNCKDLDITVKHASEVVGMHDSASDAVRKKKDSSIRIAFELVKNNEADAVVSAGNSGATMAAGMFVLKRIKGIDRPAIAQIFPTLRGKTLVLDVGGNVDCKPLNLVQFAIMGEVYARSVMDVENPKIGVLSNGEEESKGNDLTRESSTLLKSTSLDYMGYVEGRDIFNGMVDVVVCDGFVGNVVLKLSEGLAEAVSTMLKEEIKQSLLYKIGYILSRRAFINFKKKVDYTEYGGAPLLGIDGVGMICHGGSNAKAIKNAIRFAHEYARKGVNQHMVEKLQENYPLYMQQLETLKAQAAG